MSKPKRPHEKASTFERAEEFLQIFKKGAEFSQELLRENERLRFRVLDLEGSRQTPGHETDSADQVRLTTRIEELEKEKQELLKRFRDVEAENKEFASRYLEIEEENNNLANLYVASFQLHSTLDINEVLQIIVEIIINLIGAEVFGVLLLDEKEGDLKPVATEGIEKSLIGPVRPGEGKIGWAARAAENYFAESPPEAEPVDPAKPIVCIPLSIKEHVIGVIVIYKLLQQKTKFTDLDHELFTLLGGHAATAIFASKLYSESERKLSTIQGFIDLLTK
jgi:nitrate/nitrite-specific signal transduction histidine kinase